MTTEQTQEFEKLVKPLMEWLLKNCNPHTTVILDPRHAELVEGLYCFSNKEVTK